MHRMAWGQVEDMLLWKMLFTPLVFMLAFIFYKILQLRKKVAKSDNRKGRVDSPAFRGQAG
jgi:predicted permease